MNGSVIPLRPQATQAQIDDATRAGHMLADDLLYQTLAGKVEPLVSLNMHKLAVACRCILAVKLSNEVHFGNSDFAIGLGLLTQNISELTEVHLKHLKQTAPIAETKSDEPQ